MSKVTLHSKFKPLFSSDSRFYVVTGGRGSSKSFSVSYFIVLLMLLESDHTILFTRYTMKSAHISIIPEITSKIELIGQEDNFSITKDSVVCNTTGSKILFRGIRTSEGDQTANLKSIEGATTWILDEAEELSDENKFDLIDLSIRSKLKQNRVILILNPTTKEHWVYKRFFEKTGVEPGSNLTKGDTTYIHTSYLDNIDNLSPSWIKNIEGIKETNPKKYEHKVMGGWLDVAEGVIFNNWKIGKFPDMDYGYGMDFGFSNDPSSLTKVAIDSKLKKIYVDEVLYKPGLTTTELFSIINNSVENNLIIADNAEPRLIEELSRRGVNIRPCTKGAGSIVEGITLMQDYEMIVTENSTNIIKELNNYVWSDRKSGTPIDLYNHSIDGIRYYVSHRLKKRKIKNYKIF